MNELSHVAFIMDGNGRWGIKRNKTRNFGHLQGVKTVQKTVQASIQLKIPIITFFVFSTENWKRPKTEINFLLKLIKSYFKKEIKNIMQNNIKINIIGDKKKLPLEIKKILKKVENDTKSNKKLIINLALNYGSKNEIKNAFMRILDQKLKITEKSISQNLFTQNLPDPDILIRTGGKKRLSNFMLWQLSYSEIYFIDKLWPDFNKLDLIKIINNYKKIIRNYGDI
jgi:undecaprenyl diphosphate synthase